MCDIQELQEFLGMEFLERKENRALAVLENRTIRLAHKGIERDFCEVRYVSVVGIVFSFYCGDFRLGDATKLSAAVAGERGAGVVFENASGGRHGSEKSAD